MELYYYLIIDKFSLFILFCEQVNSDHTDILEETRLISFYFS